MSSHSGGDLLESLQSLLNMALIASSLAQFQGFLEGVAGLVEVLKAEISSAKAFEEEVLVEKGLFVEFSEEFLDGADGLLRSAGGDLDQGKLKTGQKVGSAAVVFFPDGDGLMLCVSSGLKFSGKAKVGAMTLEHSAQSGLVFFVGRFGEDFA